MSFWKDIKSKIKMAVGAVGVTILGASAAYWAYERQGYSGNVYDYGDEVLDHVVYGGDNGIVTAQRAGILSSIRAYAPKKIRLLGDLGYPSGLHSQKDEDLHVTPFSVLAEETDMVLGNHSFYGISGERHFIQKKYSAGPVDGKRWDNYYTLKIYKNACEIKWESTTADVKLGDPEIQKRQEKFVCKAAVEPRCAGKIMIGLTHQAAIGRGYRGNTNSSDYMEFDEKCIRNNFDYVLSGHDHVQVYSGKFRRAHYIISGVLAKSEGPFPGYLTLDNNKITIRRADVPITPAEEDED